MEVASEAHKILGLMKESRIYWQARKEVINSLLKASRSPEDLPKCVQSTGNHDKLHGLINNCLQKSTRRLPLQKDGNPQIELFRLKWSEMVVKEFNSISGKIVKEQECGEEDESVSYIYDSSSMLEFLSSIRVKNSVLTRQSPAILFSQEILKVSKYSQLRSKYAMLLTADNLIGGEAEGDLREREKKAKRIADGQSICSDIQSYLCLGCVNGERKHVYRRYFQCFYQHTGKRVDYKNYDKVWKGVIRTDSKEAVKDPQYFVFKEEIHKVYELFLCDKQLGHMLRMRQLSPTETKLDKFAPIHSTLPCKSFALYISPFCYSSTSVQDIYEMFRQVYANYFILLNTVTSLPDSILALCLMFEDVLYSTQKKIVTKMQQLHIQPLRIVFPWMFYCFIGYIEVEQFFLLLDRIIGVKSMEILPLYCVSIFFKEKAGILQAQSQSQVQQILEDSLKEDVFLETIREFMMFHL